jgi:DNA gyrase subunit A
LRIVIDLKRDAQAEIVLNQLYKHTNLELSFGVIFLALVETRPRVLNLKQLLYYYLEHRKQVVRRRTRFELEKAQKRAHILEGLKIALKNLDRIIKIIKTSKNVEIAKQTLIKEFDLSFEQAQAILEMQLQRLTGLEREKIDSEYLDLIKKIELYKSVLSSEKKIEGIIKEELLELKRKYADERRTQIVSAIEEIKIEDLIAEEDIVITISHSGYIKRLGVSSYHRQKRGGKGVTAAELREADFVEHLFIASTKDYLLIFTDKGRVFWLKAYEIPIGARTAKGKAIVNLLKISPQEKISSIIPVREFTKDKFLIMATKKGLIKKTALSAFSRPRKTGIIGITLDEEMS